MRNRTDRTVSGLVAAFTIGAGPTSTAQAFRRVEPVPLTLDARQAASIEVAGIALQLLRSIVTTDAPAVEIGIVGVRFASGPAWHATGHGSWLGRPDLPTP